VLRAFGWRVALVLTKDWFHEPEAVLDRLERLLKNEPEATDADDELEQAVAESEKVAAVQPVLTTVRPLQPSHEERKQSAPTSKQSFGDAPSAIVNTPSPPEEGRGEGKGSVQSPANARRFEFATGGSQKFWEISVAGKSFTVRFGRIGTKGQEQTKSYTDEAKA